MEMLAWPRRSWTYFGCLPSTGCIVAQLWRRSWNLMGGSSALFKTLLILVPPLEASVTRLVRRVAFRQVAPEGAGTQDPQEAVEDIPRISPRSITTVGLANWIGDQRF
jgi:hypothetical protein